MTDIFPSVLPEDKAETAERHRKEIEAFERSARLLDNTTVGKLASASLNWSHVSWCRDKIGDDEL